MRTIFLLIIVFALWGCDSKKGDQGVNIGIRDSNGDTLSLSYFDSRNEDYEFFDSDRADSVFNDKAILSKMPGQFVFGVKNKKGKPYRYLIFKKADTAITIGKNYLDVIPDINTEHFLADYLIRVVDIRYDTMEKMVRENQLVAILDKKKRDTILYLEENYFIQKKWQVVGGTFAMFDNKGTLKEMKELCTNALQQAVSSMKKKPKMKDNAAQKL